MRLKAVAAPIRSFVVTGAVGLAFASAGLLAYHYVGAARTLAGDNAQLKEQMQSFIVRLAEVEGQLGTVAKERRDLDRATLASLGSVLDRAGLSPEREAKLARALAPVAEQSGRPLALTVTADSTPTNPSFDRLLARMGDVKERAGRLATDLASTSTLVTSRQQILRSMPSVLPARGGKVSSEFGMRESPFHPGFVGMHNGLDVAADEGTPVTATADGVVVFAGAHGSFGKLVTVDHGFGITTKYGHNSLILVKKGDRVVRGQSIATVGNTGRSTGAHVHYEVAVYDKPVDPRRFLFDERLEDTAPQAASSLAQLALGGDAQAIGLGESAEPAPLRTGVEWDAPVFAGASGLVLSHAPKLLTGATTADVATAAVAFLLLAAAAAVMRVPSRRRGGYRADRDESYSAELVRQFHRKQREAAEG